MNENMPAVNRVSKRANARTKAQPRSTSHGQIIIVRHYGNIAAEVQAAASKEAQLQYQRFNLPLSDLCTLRY
jgi:hypothetical protein